MKDPQDLSNEELYCQIICKYYDLKLDELLSSDANRVLLTGLYFAYRRSDLGTNHTTLFNDKRGIATWLDAGVPELCVTYIDDAPLAIIHWQDTEIQWGFYVNHKAFENCNESPEITQQKEESTYLHEMNYTQYLRTPEWQERRRLAIEAAGRCCQLCNSNEEPFHVHHRTYVRRGYEQPGDLIVLCAHCHAKFHDKLPKEAGGE